MNLDDRIFAAAEVASISGVRMKDVANWTDRGLVDPYEAGACSRRGRGQARGYSIRDGLRLALMGDLAARYQIPLPVGRRICGAIFSEAFSPDHCSYLLLEGAAANHVAIAWFVDDTQLATYLRARPMRSCLLVNTMAIFSEVMREAGRVLAAKRGVTPGLLHNLQTAE